MRMHVSGKKLAVSGLLAAFSVVLITLAAVIETSRLFFIAAASFCIGIVLREWGVLRQCFLYCYRVFGTFGGTGKDVLYYLRRNGCLAGWD